MEELLLHLCLHTCMSLPVKKGMPCNRGLCYLLLAVGLISGHPVWRAL